MRADDFLDDKTASSRGSADAFLDDEGGPQALRADVRPSTAGAGRGDASYAGHDPRIVKPGAPRPKMGALAAAAGPAVGLDPMGANTEIVPGPTLGEQLMRPPGQAVPLSDQELADAATGETPAGRALLERRRLTQLADASRAGAPSLLPDPEADAKARQKEIKDAEPKNPAYFAGDTAIDAARGVVKVVPHLAKNAWDVLRFGADVVGADSFARFAAASSRAGDETLHALDNPNGDHNMTGAIESLGVALFGAGLNKTAGAIALGSGQSAADKYSEARGQGFDVLNATEAAVVYGLAEYMGERVSIPSLGRMVWQNGIARGLKPTDALKEALKQQGGEQATQAVQSLYDKFGSAGGDPNMTWEKYLEAVTDVAKQTAIMSGVAHGAGKVTGSMQRRAFDQGMALNAQRGAELDALAPGVLASQARNTIDAGPQLTPTETVYQTGKATISTTPRRIVQLQDVPTTPMTPEQILAIPRDPTLAPPEAVEQIDKKAPETTPDTGRQTISTPPVETIPDVSQPAIGVSAVPQGALAAAAEGRLKGEGDGQPAAGRMAVGPGAPLADAGRGLDGVAAVPREPGNAGVAVAGGAPRAGAQAGGAPRAGSGGDAALTPIDAGSRALLDSVTGGGQTAGHADRLPAAYRPALRRVYAEAEREKPGFDAAVQGIADEIGAEANLPGLKGAERAVAKTLTDYKGDPGRLKDVLRATINVDTVEKAKQAVASIFERFHVAEEGRRNLLDDSFTPKDGYRDAKFNVVINGHTAEIQVNVPEMTAAKKGPGHTLYEARQALERKSDGRIRTDEEQAAIDDLNAQMRAIYEPAWAAAKTRLNASSSTGAPLRRAESDGNTRGLAESQAVDEKGEKPGTLPSVTGMPSTSKNSTDGENRAGSAMRVVSTAPSIPVGAAKQEVDAGAHQAATSPRNDLPEPTDGQKEAGNYRKGNVSLQGLDIAIENPKGSARSGKRPDGSTWSHVMSDHYGYIRRTTGADGEQLDVYVGPHPDAPTVFVIDQVNQKGGFDEHKAMIGFESEKAAVAAYRSNFDAGWKVGPVTAMPMAEFKTWARSSDATKPLAGVAPAPVLQNRNRSDAAYVQQVSRIAANPDPDRLSFSRDFATGAPVVLADQVEGAVLGRKESITAATGRKIPVQYAVVEAHTLLPSNTADGTVNKDYAAGLAGRARVVAGNGRAAGLQAAYKLGTAVAYRKGIAADEALHGVPAAEIERMKKPVLVRIMQPEDVTANIGDESNQSGVADKSALERARDDARRLDLESLDFDDAGDPTANTVRQFVDKMPESEQTALRNPDGSPTRQGQDRIMAAIFWQAYEDEALVRLYAQATDPESKTVMSGLAMAAPQMMRLRDAGDLDIRSIVAEAAGAAINAKRRGIKLADYAAQADMATVPATRFVLQMFADNVRSARKIGETLRDAATFAHEEATKPATDMFGAVEKASRTQVLGRIHDTARSQNLEQPGGRGAARDDVQGDGENAPGREDAGPAPDDVRFSRAKRDEGQGGFGFDEGTEALLAAHTADDLKAKTDRETAALERERATRTAEQERLRKAAEGKDAKKRADDTVGDFKLGQSADQQMSGMDQLFSRAGKGAGQDVARVERLAGQIAAGWKNAPKIVVIATMADAPTGTRLANKSQLAQGADGEPAAFFYNGSVYIVASQMGTSRDVATALFHEALGHFGLRGAFGANLDGVLNQMAIAREGDVRAKAKQYGLDYSDRTQRMHAAEEVLAELAQTQPQNTWVQKVIAAIRTWLRENVAAFRDLKLSDAEIIRSFIEPARDFVKMGKQDAAEISTFTHGVKTDIPKAFANDYKALEGRKINVPVRIADTGKVVTLAVDAAQELRELDEREAVFRKLMDCLA